MIRTSWEGENCVVSGWECVKYGVLIEPVSFLHNCEWSYLKLHCLGLQC
jgi:hypothetical protein